MVVSWASPGPETRPRVRIGQRVIPAEPRQYTDGISGETVWTYHARVGGLRPGATYAYVVTADNDGNAADPFTATFRTAPHGRAAFRFTAFGDLATPNTAWVLSYGQSAYAVDAVESFQPLFHLLNGDLCYADLNPTVQPEVWRDFGNNNQTSAANRPWMPCLGNHEVEFDNGAQGFTSYLTRYMLPDNQVPGFRGCWYSFRIGSVLFVSLDADDVVYQDAGAFVTGPAALTPAASTGHPAIEPGTSFYVRGYSGGAQTAWLERTLAAGRADPSVDWIIVQMHQCACSSSATGNGSDLGIRQQWLPLFDRYQVDLVLNGHDHDYERSFPVRGAAAVATIVLTGSGPPTPTSTVTTAARGVRHQPGHRAPVLARAGPHPCSACWRRSPWRGLTPPTTLYGLRIVSTARADPVTLPTVQRDSSTVYLGSRWRAAARVLRGPTGSPTPTTRWRGGQLGFCGWALARTAEIALPPGRPGRARAPPIHRTSVTVPAGAWGWSPGTAWNWPWAAGSRCPGRACRPAS